MSIHASAEIDVQKLATLLRAIEEGKIEGLERAGKHIVALASELAPEDTGALKDSGESEVIGSTLHVSFGNGLPDDRAVAQEYGTLYMPAQPYLSIAVKEIDIVEEIARAIRARLV